MTGTLLQEEERLQIEKLIHATQDDGLLRRGKLLLLYDEGHPTMVSAKGAGLSRGRARYWKREFISRRMQVFSLDAKEQVIEDTLILADGVEKTPTKKAVPQAERPKKAAAKTKKRRTTQDQDTSTLEATVTGIEPREDAAQAVQETIDQAAFARIVNDMSGPGVLPDDPLAEAGRKVWRYHFGQMLLHEAGTLLGDDIEELHDMRVATRRMRAAFDVFGEAFIPKALKTHLKGLRTTGRTLGKVRDLDVFIEKARSYQSSLPEAEQHDLDPLLEAWGQDRQAAREKMTAYLQSDRYQTFKEKYFIFLSQPGSGVLPRSPDLHTAYLVREAAPVLIYNRLAAVRTYENLMEQASLEQFHALRIEFKKLRYTLEYFREVLGEESKDVINEIKSLQDHLGDLNDADVAAIILREFLARWDALQADLPVAQRHGPEPLLVYLTYQYRERQRLMLSFKDAWHKFSRPQLRQKLAKAVAVL